MIRSEQQTQHATGPANSTGVCSGNASSYSFQESLVMDNSSSVSSSTDNSMTTAASTSTAATFNGLNDGTIRRCRGSLPLKKRRFHEITLLQNHNHHHHHNEVASNDVSRTSSTSTTLTNCSSNERKIPSHNHHSFISMKEQQYQHHQQHNIHQRRHFENTYVDEKFAALALVAAATATSNGTIDFSALTSNLSTIPTITTNHNDSLPTTNVSTVATVTPLQKSTVTMSSKEQSFLKQEASIPSLLLQNQQEERQEQQQKSNRMQGALITTSNNESDVVNATTKISPPTLFKKGGTKGGTNLIISTKTNNITTQKPSTQQRPRVIRPPLSSPIPGGCHGRTSRNNSYCRRTPCYNGSKYCKLHYQQYMNKNRNENGKSADNSSSTNTTSNSSNNGVKSDEKTSVKRLKSKGESVAKGTTNALGASNHQSTNTTSSGRSHQDKRFTGLISDEVQCLATTTRGRPCSYVAVSGTKYCHLHADYDSNPPPRRGGSSVGGGSQKVKSSMSDIPTQCITASSSSPSSSSLDVKNVVQNSLTKINVSLPKENIVLKRNISEPLLCVSTDEGKTKGKTTSTKNTRKPKASLTTVPKNPEMLVQATQTSDDHTNDSKTSTAPISTAIIYPPPLYPCLNTVPSDQWSKRHVLIGAGTLVNHIGQVVKCGNGWVTISVKTGLSSNLNGSKKGAGSEIVTNEIVDNRRAVELYLLPEDLTTVTDLPFPVRTESDKKPVKSQPTTATNVVQEAMHKSSPKLIETTKNIEGKQKFHATQQSNNKNVSTPTNVKKVQTEAVSNQISEESKETKSKKDEKKNEITKNPKIDFSNEKSIPRSVSPTSQNEQKDGVVCQKCDEVDEKSLKAPSVEKVGSRRVDKQEADGKVPTTLIEKKHHEAISVVEPSKSDSVILQNDDIQQESVVKQKGAAEPKQSSPKNGNSSTNANLQETCSSNSIKSFPSKLTANPESNSTQNSQSKKSSTKLHKGADSESVEDKANPNSSLLLKGEANSQTTSQTNESTDEKKNLTLMEELVLAQTGRRIKNVNLLLGSGGGRTIQRPKRYEDKTLIKKKRNRQKQDGEIEDFSKRKKHVSSSALHSPNKPKSPRSFTELPKSNKFIEASQDEIPLNVKDAKNEHRMGKIKA